MVHHQVHRVYQHNRTNEIDGFLRKGAENFHDDLRGKEESQSEDGEEFEGKIELREELPETDSQLSDARFHYICGESGSLRLESSIPFFENRSSRITNEQRHMRHRTLASQTRPAVPAC